MLAFCSFLNLSRDKLFFCVLCAVVPRPHDVCVTAALSPSTSHRRQAMTLWLHFQSQTPLAVASILWRASKDPAVSPASSIKNKCIGQHCCRLGASAIPNLLHHGRNQTLQHRPESGSVQQVRRESKGKVRRVDNVGGRGGGNPSGIQKSRIQRHTRPGVKHAWGTRTERRRLRSLGRVAQMGGGERMG